MREARGAGMGEARGAGTGGRKVRGAGGREAEETRALDSRRKAKRCSDLGLDTNQECVCVCVGGGGGWSSMIRQQALLSRS